MDDDPMFVMFTVTCHTAGCGNADVPIDVLAPDVDTPLVVCGVCGYPITTLTRTVGADG